MEYSYLCMYIQKKEKTQNVSLLKNLNIVKYGLLENQACSLPQIYCIFFFSLFFNKPGTNDRQAHIVNTPIEVQENASLELLIFCNVLPACIAITDGGATPQNVPKVKIYNGTPITGAAKLINQLGRIGVIRKNSIQLNRLSRCFSTCLDHSLIFFGQKCLIKRLPTKLDKQQHNVAPNAEQKQIRKRAIGKRYKKPNKMERNNDPGMANVCKLKRK